jgi:hypothetical protein
MKPECIGWKHGITRGIKHSQSWGRDEGTFENGQDTIQIPTFYAKDHKGDHPQVGD